MNFEIIKTTNKEIVFSQGLQTCKNCGKKMISAYNNLPDEIKIKLDNYDIQTESYSDSGICRQCIKKGGFKRSCDICRIEYEFPKEFAFEIPDWHSGFIMNHDFRLNKCKSAFDRQNRGSLRRRLDFNARGQEPFIHEESQKVHQGGWSLMCDPDLHPCAWIEDIIRIR